MDLPSIFHLHYHVPDVDFAASLLSAHGITPTARFGSVDGESVALAPEEDTPPEFTRRLQTNRGGFADVTLTPAPRLDFDHFGVVVDEVSDVVERAREHGWSVTENERRTFLVTPWGFRVELQAADSDVVGELGPASDCQFTNVSLAVPVEARDDISRGLHAVLGDVHNLRVVPVRGPKAAVREARVEGEHVEQSRFEMASLAANETA
ncbi:hypothetical protein GJR96_15320 [Haloferax sp. MBLA0076]|uniref:VOC domain-containing protein n=1 Tax=Haloferax litoreum TaxID=2666140 RepID=A0A6A8GJG0_9EURY|nr:MULTISPECIES: hypothetical protein [Haloferax]KAB1194741.1 hypothetical protein Hfx1148_15250 [Haloferax sp. CBA1148]MRX23323.1 hypothetical protein [Haloferax litoreum]